MPRTRDMAIRVLALALLVAVELPVHLRWYRADLLPPDDFAGYAAAVAHVHNDLELYGTVPRWCPRTSGGAAHFMSTMKERLAAPLVPDLGPVRATKALVVVLRTAAALVFFLAFVRVAGSSTAAIPAAYAYAYGAQTAHLAAYGHVDALVVLVLLPGIAVAAAEAIGRRAWTARLLLAMLLALTCRANLLAWQMALLLVGVIFVMRPRVDGDARPSLRAVAWRATGPAILTAALVAAPILWLVKDGPHYAFDAAPSPWVLSSLSFPSPLVLINRTDWLSAWLPHLYDGIFTGLPGANVIPRHACYVGITVLAVIGAALASVRRHPDVARWMGIAGVVAVVQLILAHGPHPMAEQLVARSSVPSQRTTGLVVASVVGAMCLGLGALLRGNRRRLVVGAGLALLLASIPWFLVLRTVIPLWTAMRSPAHFADTLVFPVAWAFGMAIVALERRWMPTAPRRFAFCAVLLTVVVIDLWPSHRAFGLGTPSSAIDRSVGMLALELPRQPSVRVLPARSMERTDDLILESIPASSASSWVRWENTVWWTELLAQVRGRFRTRQAESLASKARIVRTLLPGKARAAHTATGDAAVPLTPPVDVYPEAWWTDARRNEARATVEPLAVGRVAPGELRVEMPPHRTTGQVVFSEAYHPWWTATIDGRPASVQIAHVALLAVTVPPSAADLHLTFVPPRTLRAAELVSQAAWVLSAALAALALLWTAFAGATRARHA